MILFKVDRIADFLLYLLQLHCSYRKLLEEHRGTSFDLWDEYRETSDEKQSCREKHKERLIEGKTKGSQLQRCEVVTLWLDWLAIKLCNKEHIKFILEKVYRQLTMHRVLTFAKICLSPITVLYAAYALEQSSAHNICKSESGIRESS